MLQGSCLQGVRSWQVLFLAALSPPDWEGRSAPTAQGCLYVSVSVTRDCQSDLRFGQFCTSFILPWHKVCSWVLTPNNHISSESLPASFLSDNRGPGVVGWACRRNYSPGALASPPYPVSPLPAPLHPTLLLSCIWYHSASPIVFSWLKLLRDVYWRRGWNKASTSYILELTNFLSN